MYVNKNKLLAYYTSANKYQKGVFVSVQILNTNC